MLTVGVGRRRRRLRPAVEVHGRGRIVVDAVGLGQSVDVDGAGLGIRIRALVQCGGECLGRGRPVALRGDVEREGLGVIGVGLHGGVGTAGCADRGHALDQGHGVVDVAARVGDDLIAAHAVRESVEEGDGVGDDLGVAGVVTVHQPPCELEFRVEPGALAQQGVGGAVSCGRVAGVNVVGRGGGRCEPAQIDGGITDAESRPVEDGDRVRNADVVVGEENRRAAGSAQHHRGLEPPQVVDLDRASPPQHQAVTDPAGRVCAIEKAPDVVACLLRRADRQSVGAHDGCREGVDRGECTTDRGGVSGARGQVRRVDAVALEVVDHEDSLRAGAALAEDLRCREGQQSPHAGGQGVEGARLRGEVGGAVVARGHADDDLAAIVGARESGIEASARVLGERASTREHGAGQGRRRRRG